MTAVHSIRGLPSISVIACPNPRKRVEGIGPLRSRWFELEKWTTPFSPTVGNEMPRPKRSRK